MNLGRFPPMLDAARSANLLDPHGRPWRRDTPAADAVVMQARAASSPAGEAGAAWE
jgi:hypothetical protein